MTEEIEQYVVNITANAKKDLRKIIYKVDKNVVNVLLIVDSRRNVQDFLMERLIK
jgi:hypothetical protein